MATPRTLSQKVWDRHVVRTGGGQPDLLYIDLHLVHEVTSPQAFDGLRLAGRGVRRPDRRNPSKACGLVTSWTRWRSMYSRSGSPGARCTTWRSQTFSANVFGSASVLGVCGTVRAPDLLVLRGCST